MFAGHFWCGWCHRSLQRLCWRALIVATHRSRGCLHAPSEPSAVRSSRSCTVSLWGPEVWPCNTSTPGTPLVVCSGPDHVQTGYTGILVYAWFQHVCMVPAYLAETLNRAADVDSRRRLRSGSSTALLVPMTGRRTLGDRAFPVAAAQVWNSLPTTLTSQSSLLTFRQQWHSCLSSRILDIHATLP